MTLNIIFSVVIDLLQFEVWGSDFYGVKIREGVKFQPMLKCSVGECMFQYNLEIANFGL